MEIAGRAGGLVPTNRLALRDIVLYGDAPRSELDRYDLERDPAIARTLLDLAPVQRHDLFVIISNSGVNGVVVELATLVKERGHDLIAITSRAHGEAAASRHPSGRKLTDLADVVLDNHAPYGDAVLPLPGGGATGPSPRSPPRCWPSSWSRRQYATCSKRAKCRPCTSRPTSPRATSTTSAWRPATRAASAAAPDPLHAARPLHSARHVHGA
ncbi:sugar isomerase domain-containing protein [Nonomuraea rubra]|uniref:sugar isomerase domain-containing protein n=1 Tax=Nonomuraea rubra TaxID=46180 RepID=UPI0031EBAE5F